MLGAQKKQVYVARTHSCGMPLCRLSLTARELFSRAETQTFNYKTTARFKERRVSLYTQSPQLRLVRPV